MFSSYKRTRIWINPGFQTRILARMVFYVIGSSVVIFHLAFFFELCWRMFHGAPGSLTEAYMDFIEMHRFFLIGWVVFMPWVMFDVIRFSHRIAGPFYRCRRMMLEMAAGKRVPDFKPRKNDLMPEFFESFNVLIEHCNEGVQPAPESEHHSCRANGLAHAANGSAL